MSVRGPTSNREDESGLQSLDPGLLELVETTTRRVLGGETVDLEAMVREHPLWAETIRICCPR